jgi:hypothetical protein
MFICTIRVNTGEQKKFIVNLHVFFVGLNLWMDTAGEFNHFSSCKS